MERIICPGCQQSIRVPEEALGKRAKCTFCKCHFLCGLRPADGIAPSTRLLRNIPVAQKRFLPALVLLFASALGIFQNSLQAIQAFADPRAFEEKTLDQFERVEQLKEMGPVTVTWRPRIQIASAILSTISLIGAFAMLRARRHGLAMIGSAVGMFNIANCCCFANILIGGWALSTLMKPDVRAEFGGSSSPEEPPSPTQLVGD